MASWKYIDWNPRGHVHMDKLEKLTLAVNTDGNLAYRISISTEHV